MLRLCGSAIELALAICHALERNGWRDVVDMTVSVADDPRRYELVSITQPHPLNPPSLRYGSSAVRMIQAQGAAVA
ncbi:hypothetical protein QO018_005463 [Azospirillum picis]|uniref:Uncharacterized protein n=1 Tax=Azospirillum picis TaxID=488438 RepID=A0ABU0MTY7_9PROT|nr:hypothetical protein [Azospirillum picis]